MVVRRRAPALPIPTSLLRYTGLVLAAALAALLAAPPAARAVEETYVAELLYSRVNVLARTATGDVTPLRSIQGPATGLVNPIGIAVDEVHGELFVVDSYTKAISVFPLGADGDTVPLRTLGGPATGLVNPIGVVVDAGHGEIFVADYDPAAGVKVFSRTAAGDTAPLRTLTSVNRCTYLALDPLHDELVVAATYDGVVKVFDRAASGAAAPLRQLWGGVTGINEPRGIAVDLANDELLVGDAYNYSIRVFARTATGNVAPLRVIQGPLTNLAWPHGIFVDPLHGEILVANRSGGNTSAMAVFDRLAEGSVAPLRTVAGLDTGLFWSTDVAVIAHAVFDDGFESGDGSSWSGGTE
ncbi:MAG: hypothetical protein KJ058_15385 [Thermoanaerobaculia bacterium]|nr:hypothetical protein [Thermoanaerobaculia bacterium]